MRENSADQFKAYKEIYEFAAKNITETRDSFEKHYRFTVWSIALIGSFVIATFYFLVGKEYKDIAANVQAKADTHFAALDNEIRGRISAQFATKQLHQLIEQVAVEQTKRGLGDVINVAVTRAVEARVKAEEPQIHETVVQETKKGVDALSPLINAAVDSQTKLAEEKLQSQMAQYQIVVQASTLAVLARNGDGGAYDNLMRMAARSDVPAVKSLATTTRNELFLEFDSEATGFYSTRQFLTPKTAEQLKVELSDPDPLSRKAAIDTLVSQGNKTIVPMLIEILDRDPFIINRIASYRGLTLLTGQKFDPPDAAQWKTWWAADKDKWLAK